MRLYLLNLGHCDVDKGLVLTPGSGVGERLLIPIVAYLIETDDGQRILVDTGMHRRHISNPDATSGGLPANDAIWPVMRPEDDIASRLGELGLEPKDIDILVSTHFHFDHAGNHAHFGSARIVTQRVAYDFAKANPAACPPELWDLPHLNYDLIDGDQELAPGVELIQTDGHVPGHMSVVVRLPQTGTIVLAIDAIYTMENVETDNWAGQVLPESGRISAHRLMEIANREHGLLIPGHDPTTWANLRYAPFSYD